LCPVNTIKNWVDEFEKWLDGDLSDTIGQVYDGSLGKSLWERALKTKDWMKRGTFLSL